MKINHKQINKIKIAQKVLKIFKKNYFEAFIVGGAVRDLLLEVSISDVDITTNAYPSAVQKLFSSLPTSVKYGSLKIFFEGHSFEVTTYRKEGKYVLYRYPSTISFVSDVKIDLMRRDFTINSLLLNEDYEIIDYVNGREDLSKKLIRTMCDPYVKLTQDALRIMRIFYLQAKLNFDIEVRTKKVLKENIWLLHKIKPQTLLQEWRKILKQKNIQKVFLSLKENNALEVLTSFKKIILFSLDKKITHFNYELFFSLAFILDPKIINDYPFNKEEKNFFQQISFWYRKQNYLLSEYDTNQHSSLNKQIKKQLNLNK
jgi:poly(A) polymerase/tRNA nucleotidyltransferase (CCA-adding enzyme)